MNERWKRERAKLARAGRTSHLATESGTQALAAWHANKRKRDRAWREELLRDKDDPEAVERGTRKKIRAAQSKSKSRAKPSMPVIQALREDDDA